MKWFSYPAKIYANLNQHRYLVGQLVRRDVFLKYHGSYLGIIWSFFYPLLLLATFSYVFGNVLGARWPEAAGHTEPFYLVMYCGLIAFNIFSEVTATAPRIIYGYPSYVKKIIFPLEILPLVHVSTAVVHGCINFLVLAIGVALFGKLHATIFLAPIVLLPIVFLTLGIAWFLAAAGMFFRDLFHVMPVLVQITLFISPVFYTVSAVPPSLKWFYMINPISEVIVNLRSIVVWGKMPVWTDLGVSLLISLLIAIYGYYFFMRLKEDFVDVI